MDHGNPNPGNIGEDFNRFGLLFWNEVHALDALNKRRRELLDELLRWRNAIAHQDFDPAKLGGVATLQLQTVRKWRSSVNRLAAAFDFVMRSTLLALLSAEPWSV
jgi:hypothetical protein